MTDRKETHDPAKEQSEIKDGTTEDMPEKAGPETRAESRAETSPQTSSETSAEAHAEHPGPERDAPARSSRMSSLRQEIDRLFDDFGWPESWPDFGFGGDRESRTTGPAWRTLMRGTAPAMDLVERDGEYELQAELPGLSARDVDVTVADGRLIIRGEKTAERKEERENMHLSERSYGSFQRAFRLPGGVDADRIEASFENGVLKLRLPKTTDAREGERKIKISGG
jgi:HSP20 family protein